MIKYSKLIRLLVRFAYDVKKTVFEPSTDGYTVRLLVKNPQSGDDVIFGFLRPEKSFIDFLKSKQYGPKTPSDISVYLKDGSFQLDQTPENSEALEQINKNFEVAQNLTHEQLIEYMRRKPFNVMLTASFRKKPLGLEAHDAALDHYKIFLQTQQGHGKIQHAPANQGA
jgi:hypothetical protein